MLGNLSVKSKLMVGFGCALAMTAMVGLFASISISSLVKKDRNMYENMTVPLAQMAVYERTYESSRKYIADFCSDPDPVHAGALADSIKVRAKVLDSLEKAYSGTYIDAQDSATFTTLMGLRGQWMVQLAELFKLNSSSISDRQAFRHEHIVPIANELSGMLEIVVNKNTSSAEQTAAANDSNGKRTMIVCWILIALSLLICGILAVVISRAIVVPLLATRDVLQALSRQDLSQRLSQTSQDELGEMARALDKALDGLSGVISGLQGNSRELSASSEELSSVSGHMREVAGRTATRAQSVSAATEELSSSMQTVSAAAEQSSANIGMMASAVEEMSISVNEIARNAESTRGIMNEVVQQARGAGEQVEHLESSAAEIGKLIDLIEGIAEQTKLLALNATIEAARAGESGKGFAVVASEVKALAHSTATATEDIRATVTSMQSSTSGAVSNIRKIQEVVGRAESNVVSIAGAVQEQAATTREIAANVGQASAGMREVTRSVAETAGVTRSIAQEMSAVRSESMELQTATEQVGSSGQELARMAADLDRSATGFRLS